MAIRLNDNSRGLVRTASLPDYNATYTCMGWFQITNARLEDTTVFYLGTDSASAFDYLAIHTDGTTLKLYAGGTAVTGTALSTATWYHLAIVRESGTSEKAYLNGALDITNTTNVGTGRTAPQRLELGTLGSLSDIQWLDGRVQGLKVWDAALTLEEVAQEVQTLRPQRWANLHLWSPNFPGSGERTRDYSGTGRDWTEKGTITEEDPPPVGYGAPVLWVQPVTAVSPVIGTVGGVGGLASLLAGDAALAQLVYPTADVTDGSWTNELGSATDLYASVDEPTTASDSDYIQSSVDPSNDTVELALGDLDTPSVDTGHILRYRIRRN